MTEQLHVAYLVRYSPSPSETFVLDEALALESIGVKVSVWALDRVSGAVSHQRFDQLLDRVQLVPRPSRPAAWWATLTLPTGALLRRIRVRWAENGRPRDFRRVAWLAGAWRRAKVDVVRIHHAAETARFGVSAAELAGLASSLAVHARDLFVPEPDLAWMLRHARHVSTITPFHRERILRSGLAPQRVQLLPCAVSLPDEGATVPADWATLRVLSVGRLVAKKGHDLLIEACARLAREGRSVHLTLVGDGGEGARLRARIHALCDAEPKLTIDAPGALSSEEIFSLLLSGDFHVFALACRVAVDGDRDGLPVSLLEAAAAGLPLVTTAMQGFESEFSDKGGAVLVPIQPRGEATPDALANALATVYDAGPEAWKRTAATLRSAAARRASPKETARRLLRRLEPLREVPSESATAGAVGEGSA